MRKSGFKPYFTASTSRKSFWAKKIAKIWLLTLVWSLFSFLWFSSANTYNNCTLFSESKEQNAILSTIAKDPLVQNWAIPISAIEKALDNLFRHCCASDALSKSTKTCTKNANNYKDNAQVPQSTALFDQLIDVQMRRWTNDLKNYPGLKADEEFKKYQENLEKTMKDPKGALPQTFLAEYKKNWGYEPQHLLPFYYDHSANDYLQALLESPALKNAKSRNLRSKYLNTCAIASYFTLHLDPNPQTSVTDLTKANQLCKKMINEQLEKQMSLLSRIITYKSNKASNDTIQDYALTYFGSRLNYLQTQIDKLNTQLLSTSRQIPYLVPKCN